MAQGEGPGVQVPVSPTKKKDYCLKMSIAISKSLQTNVIGGQYF
jgi:hypothetical protein